MTKETGFKLYKRLLGYTNRYRTVLIIALCGVALSGVFEAGLFGMLKPILDKGFFDKDPTFIRWMPALLIGVFFIKSIFAFLGNVGMQWVAQKVIMTLRKEMFARLITMPMSEYDKTTTGSLLSKLTYDVNQLLTISSFALVTLIKDTATIVGLLFVMFYNSWKISLIMFLIAPFIAIILRVVSKRLRKLSHSAQESMGELNHVTEEAIRGHREIKLFNAYDFIEDRFNRINRRLQQVNVKIMVASEAASPMVQLMIVFCVAIIISYAASQVEPGGLTPGGFLTTLGAMVGLLNPIKRLTRLNESLQRGLAGAESIFSLIDAPIEKTKSDSISSKNLEYEIEGKILFDNVDFFYHEDKTVFSKFNLEIKPKETVALVGASGSGKSTFANLLAGFYLPQEGDIWIDDISLNSLPLREYRHILSYVSQNVVLFADTIANNIALGEGEYSRDKVIQAAKNANAWEFIEQMPEGLDTLIGENGARLSGGQRQRIAIARALYKNAPILILDEATSSLDTESEYYIQEAIQVLSQNTTTIIIAHRLSTIENADRIIVFDQGQIVEMGTHSELLEKNNIYARLYRLGDH